MERAFHLLKMCVQNQEVRRPAERRRSITEGSKRPIDTKEDEDVRADLNLGEYLSHGLPGEEV